MEIIFRSSLVCDLYHNYTKQIAEHFKVGFRFFFQELVLFKKKKTELCDFSRQSLLDLP